MKPDAIQAAEPDSEHKKRVNVKRPSISCPPYNPGLQQLIDGKRAWTEPLNEKAKAQGFLGWHQRGVLPHCDLPGVTQFVTFRIWDAMPASRRSEWEALLRVEERRERSKRLEAYLDLGHGACWLGDSKIAELAEGVLRFFNGQKYRLDAWVIMPNHVHIVIQVWETPLSALVKNWKGYIAREANKTLRREGGFWQREYWDTLIRSEEQHRKAVNYVENNPVNAELAHEPKVWPWSSARYRDEYALLRLPTRLGGDANERSEPTLGVPTSKSA